MNANGQPDQPVTFTIPTGNDMLQGLDTKSLAVGDELSVNVAVTASDENGLTLEVKSATKPEEPGTPEAGGEGDDEGAETGADNTEKATDYVMSKRKSM